MKSVCIWSFSGPYFPAFGLSTERYGVSLRIQSECGKYIPEKLGTWTPFPQCKLEAVELRRSIILRWKKKKKIFPVKKHAFLTCILNLAVTLQTETITLKEVRSN